MKKITFEVEFRSCQFDELKESEKDLLNIAKEASENAYAIYSDFKVGCAVSLSNGKIFSANNQENASYPNGACAERIALMYANAGHPDIPVVGLYIAAQYKGEDLNYYYTKQPITPCGLCRQVILEREKYQRSPIKIYLYGRNEVYIIDSVNYLLPLGFEMDK